MIDVKELQKLTSTMKVLYVEDDLEIQNNTKMIFEDLFKEVTTADNGQEALTLYEENSYDIVITDINMPNMNGIELIQAIKQISPDQVVIIISAHNETEYFINGIQSGIQGYILKPVDYEQLFESLNQVVHLLHNRKENLQYKLHMEELVKEKTISIENNYQEMQKMLMTDKTTGLSNANMLYQYLDLYSINDLSLCIFSVDNYNFITQLYGNEICNDLIKTTAHYLQLNLPQYSSLYRYGENEFIATFTEGEEHYFVDLITQINAFFKESPITKGVGGKDIYVSLSTAIVHEQSPVNILQKAKATLNELSKLDLFGHYKVYEENSYFIKGLQAESHWYEKIREIIENDKLIPYFHPIVSNKTKEIIKYECLVRADDDGKIISPIHFLESAKKAGLIGNLSRIMINKCFKFFSNSNIHFSLNITNQDLLDDKFVDFVISKQRHYKIEPKQVMFEILEDVTFDKNYDSPINNLTKLQEHGFLLALDDFGSDKSNLNRLVSILNIDYLKIDGQFIKGIDKNKKHYKIVESIVLLANKLGIKIIAEFVSTKEEYETVNALGIDYSQGYYFFKPENSI